MTSSGIYSSLINAIETLYLHIATSVLYKRMKAHHQLTGHMHIPQSDISSTLADCLEQISAVENKGDVPSQKIDFSLLNNNKVTKPVEKAFIHIQHRTVDRNNIKELSNYFKEQMNGAELHPSIAVRLEHSTWEHIHEAIRYSRLGDQRNSRIHAEIANHACRELSHYVSIEHHEAFITGIESQLGRI